MGNTTRFSLTFRYLSALLIIAFISLLMFAAIVEQLRRSHDDAFLVNVSGRQRMLSQRIALLASSIQGNPDPSIQRQELTAAVDLMRDSHAMLLKLGVANAALPMSDTLRELYFGTDGENLETNAGVDTTIRQYLALADRLVGRETVDASAIDIPLSEFAPSDFAPNANGFTASGDTASDPEANILNELLRRAQQPDLLGQLDAIVAQYELEAEGHQNRFWKTELLFVVAVLLTLVLVACFIFRPMVNQIIHTLMSLKTVNGELMQFTYRMSHDLRAPVVSSLGIVGLAQESLDEGDVAETQTSLKHIERSLRRVSSTTEDILHLLQSRMSDATSESFNLDALIDASITSVADLPGAESVVMDTQVDVDRPIQTKRIYVQQTIENLLSNAIKYRDPDQAKSFVRIAATVNNGVCRIDVSDNGLGIEPVYREKIFSMFQRFHPKVATGTGLGLYLVQQNAMALQGQIQYIALPEGSCFRLTFPIE